MARDRFRFGYADLLPRGEVAFLHAGRWWEPWPEGHPLAKDNPEGAERSRVQVQVYESAKGQRQQVHVTVSPGTRCKVFVNGKEIEL